MTRRGRLGVFLAGAAVFAALFCAGCLDLPSFGGSFHPYGTLAVRAAERRHTSNAIASVNFDQRALDTLGEETIFFSAVLGTLVLLRRTAGERRTVPAAARTPVLLRWFGVLMLPVALVVGLYVVAHGQVSPGGGFQGGVVTATALHLLYVAADYRALERFRRVGPFSVGEAVGEGAYVVTGIAGALAGSAFLANVLPTGTFATLSSGGTVAVLNAAIGLEVGCGVVVLLAQFLDQAVEFEEPAERAGGDRPGGDGCGGTGSEGHAGPRGGRRRAEDAGGGNGEPARGEEGEA